MRPHGHDELPARAGTARRRARGLLAPLALLLLVALAPFAGCRRAADAPDDVAQWAHDLPHEVMSPFCPGRALAECPSSQADELRRWIIDQARAGATRQEVEDSLYRNFGEKIRQVPRAEGVGLLAYAMPVAFIVGGAALLGLFLARRGGGGAAVIPPMPGPSGGVAVDPDLERLLDEEIDEEGDG